MQDMHGDVRPEFAKAIRKGVPPDGVSVLAGEPSKGPGLARVIRQRNALRDAPAQYFGSIEAGVTLIVGSDDDARGGVDESFQDTAPAQGIVTLVLMENCGQGKDDQVVAIRLIDETSPIIPPEAGQAFAQLRVCICSFRQQRGDAHEDKRRVVKTVLGGEDKSLPWCRWRRDHPGADGAEIRHDTEDALGLRVRRRGSRAPGLSS